VRRRRPSRDPPIARAHRALWHALFRDGAGIFYGYGNYRGVMVQLRFHWMSRGPDQARWEQAFSADEGQTWETNWIMEFSRVTEASCVSDVTSTAVVA
jgi:hypothetical protein